VKILKTILEISNLVVSYDRIEVLHGISLVVREDEIVSMIGANGAGKSTTMRAIIGSAPIGNSGITLFGQNVSHWSSYRIVRIGVGFVPEGRRLFSQMSVRENLEMGCYFTDQRKDFQKSLDYVLSIFPKLEGRLEQLAGTLSGGEQQMLAVGRALMSHPRLLLLDEPSLGLAPLVAANIFRVIQEINRKGTAILLVEQNARMALRLCHRAYILEIGRITREAEGRSLLNDDSVQQAYLGKKRVTQGLKTNHG
jgi:branched-chain amino acid transport system ATP-binding protein